jgi:hypothetical protein
MKLNFIAFSVKVKLEIFWELVVLFLNAGFSRLTLLIPILINAAEKNSVAR